MGKDGGGSNFLIDFALGGISGAVAKTITAPIERIKLVVQTQDANPKIRSGEVPRYKGIVDCGVRIYKEQGMRRFWDGNFTNCIRYFPTQAFNLAFKDSFKNLFPKYNPKTEFASFFGANLVSGGCAAACSLTIVYPLDYARTRLASDVGSGKKSFSGLGDCIMKTMQGPGGFLALYTVRRRLQMQSEKPPEEHLYKGTLDCFKKVASEEGLVKGLYKGFGANVLRSVGGALVLVFYDRAKTYLGL